MFTRKALWRVRPAPAADRVVTAGGRAFPVDIARHPRARRYVLRMTPDGRLRLTVPRGAAIAAGLSFASRQHDWIVREWRRLEGRTSAWASGMMVWYRGERVPITVTDDLVTFADRRVPLSSAETAVRTAVERHLRAAATAELVPRTRELAERCAITVAAVSVRNQRSRWGSCSSRGRVALNWRLIQMPPSVSDYVILHELAHRRHQNHSTRFWREVAALCPWWQDAERWLRRHGKDLL